MTTTLTSVKIPASAQALIDAWRGFKEAATAFNSRMDSLVAAEIKSRNIPGDELYRVAIDHREARIDMEKTSCRILRCLIQVAENAFAPKGASLDIPEPNSETVPEVEASVFDPAAIWEYLAHEYGGSAGQTKAYSDAAKKLGSDLDIRVGAEPKIVGGRTVFDVTVYGDRVFGRVISHNDSQTLNNILTGLYSAGEWSGLWSHEEEVAVSWARHDIRLADNSKSLPERRTLGEDVLIVPFKSKWEYRLSPRFAEQIQLFLSEFNGFHKANW